MQRFLCLLALMVPLSALQVQAGDVQAGGQFSPNGSRIFPLALVLEAAEFAVSAGEVWRPDWPVELPVDAFRVNHGEISRITLEGEGILLTFRYDREGRLKEFPFMLDGRMAQVSLGFRNGEIREVSLHFPPYEDTWELEFLEYQGPEGNPDYAAAVRPWRDFPAIVRASFGDTWYFITLSRWTGGITEAWFDVDGNVLGGYRFSLTEIGANQRIRLLDFLHDDNSSTLVYYYDSWGFITRVSGPGGVYTVLHYRDALPRYWERRGDAGLLYFQWDANGFLVRMTRTGAAEPEGRPVEYRFEYILDERGNWVERQEIRMFRRHDLLFSSQGTVLRRILEYKQP